LAVHTKDLADGPYALGAAPLTSTPPRHGTLTAGSGPGSVVGATRLTVERSERPRAHAHGPYGL